MTHGDLLSLAAVYYTYEGCALCGDGVSMLGCTRAGISVPCVYSLLCNSFTVMITLHSWYCNWWSTTQVVISDGPSINSNQRFSFSSTHQDTETQCYWYIRIILCLFRKPVVSSTTGTCDPACEHQWSPLLPKQRFWMSHEKTVVSKMGKWDELVHTSHLVCSCEDITLPPHLSMCSTVLSLWYCKIFWECS